MYYMLCVCVSLKKTPEKRSHNGYTNLPDVVQPSHSPTDSATHSSPGKDSVYDVSFTDAKYISPESLVYFCVCVFCHLSTVALPRSSHITH